MITAAECVPVVLYVSQETLGELEPALQKLGKRDYAGRGCIEPSRDVRFLNTLVLFIPSMLLCVVHCPFFLPDSYT